LIIDDYEAIARNHARLFPPVEEVEETGNVLIEFSEEDIANLLAAVNELTLQLFRLDCDLSLD
jgi:hypothetical protein